MRAISHHDLLTPKKKENVVGREEVRRVASASSALMMNLHDGQGDPASAQGASFRNA